MSRTVCVLAITAAVAVTASAVILTVPLPMDAHNGAAGEDLDKPPPGPPAERFAYLERLLGVADGLIAVTPEEVVYLVNRPGTRFVEPQFRTRAGHRAVYWLAGDRWHLTVYTMDGLQGLLQLEGTSFGAGLTLDPDIKAKRVWPRSEFAGEPPPDQPAERPAVVDVGKIEPPPPGPPAERFAYLEKLLGVEDRVIGLTPEEVVYLVNRQDTRFVEPEHRTLAEHRAEYWLAGDRWHLTVFLLDGLQGLIQPVGTSLGTTLKLNPDLKAKRFWLFSEFVGEPVGGLRLNRPIGAGDPPPDPRPDD